MNAQGHIVPRVVGENSERQLRRAWSLGSPIEPFRSIVQKVTSRIERFAIYRHNAARALAGAPENAHQNILAPDAGPPDRDDVACRQDQADRIAAELSLGRPPLARPPCRSQFIADAADRAPVAPAAATFPPHSTYRRWLLQEGRRPPGY
jgi:hypothetical protein